METKSGWLRWIRWGAFVLIFVLAASALSAWQFDRRTERVEQIQLVVDNFDMPAEPLADIDWQLNSDGVALQEWRPALITGRYLPEATLLVRNRPLAGRAGFLHITPFELSDGQILIVERGWVATGNDGGIPDDVYAISASDRTAIVRLRAGEKGDPAPSESGSISSLNLEYLAAELEISGAVITEFYGRLVSETPPDASYPLQMPKPSLNEGNHLSYALQWILFGFMAIVALVWAIRRERAVVRGVEPKRNLGRIANEDANAEDALT